MIEVMHAHESVADVLGSATTEVMETWETIQSNPALNLSLLGSQNGPVMIKNQTFPSGATAVPECSYLLL